MNKCSYGVLSAEHALSFQTEQGQVFEQLGRQASAVDLYRKMLKYDLDQLWIIQGDQGDSWPGPQDDFFQVPEGSGWHFKRYPEDPKQPISSVAGYCTGGSPEAARLRMLRWPEQTGWEWEEKNPQVVLNTINLLTRRLGVQLSSSPGVTGRSFILRDLEAKGKHHYLGSVEADLHKLPFKSAAKSLAWKQRHILAGERCYLHHIDKNSMFLSAAAGLEIGIGNPKRPLLPLTGPLKPGLYQISLDGQDLAKGKRWRQHFDGQAGPDPLYGSLEDENRQEWVTAPLLKLLYDFGYRVEIHRCWTWEKSSRWLEEPARKLWALRTGFQAEAALHAMETQGTDALSLAADSMKSIINTMFGILGSDLVKDKRYYRPDIWAATIEYAKARMLYNIDSMAAQRQIWPVAVLTDGLWYLSPERDVWTALAPLMDRSKTGLGAYKHEYTLAVDQQVAICLELPDVASMHNALDELIEQRKVVPVAA